jgi:hypothetical protein
MTLTLYHIFAIQVLTSTIVYFVLSYLFLFPYLKIKSRYTALIILSLPHLIRHIGMTLLTPGAVVGANLNQDFAASTAIGDYITLILAIVTIIALKKKSKAAIPVAWVLNLCGSADIILAMVKGVFYQVLNDLGPGWYIVTFWVPLLVVAHVLSFIILTKKQAGLQRSF